MNKLLNNMNNIVVYILLDYRDGAYFNLKILLAGIVSTIWTFETKNLN